MLSSTKLLLPLAAILFSVPLAAAPAPCRAVTDADAPPPDLAILQGATSADTTQIAVLVRRREPVTLRLQDPVGNLLSPVRAEERGSPGSAWAVMRATFNGLKPDVDYRLVACDIAGQLVDQRHLSTLDIGKSKVRFAVASCMDDSYVTEQEQMWTELLSRQPEMLFVIGDNTYADFVWPRRGVATTPALLWERHAETRRTLKLFRVRKLVPTFATWDDHDFGKGDGDASYPYREQSRDIFTTFFPLEAMGATFERGPGLSSRLTAFRQRFFLMDNRYFRTKETHWGDEQERWLFDELASPEPTWLIDGDQFFGGYHRFESYEGNHPASFARFLGKLRTVTAPIVFVSGDRHLVELMEISDKEIGYRTYEMTTSPIHAKTFPDAFKRDKNPRQLTGVAGTLNYAIFESRGDSGLDFNVTAYGPGRELFTRSLQVRRPRSVRADVERHSVQETVAARSGHE